MRPYRAAAGRFGRYRPDTGQIRVLGLAPDLLRGDRADLAPGKRVFVGAILRLRTALPRTADFRPVGPGRHIGPYRGLELAVGP